MLLYSVCNFAVFVVGLNEYLLNIFRMKRMGHYHFAAHIRRILSEKSPKRIFHSRMCHCRFTSTWRTKTACLIVDLDILSSCKQGKSQSKQEKKSRKKNTEKRRLRQFRWTRDMIKDLLNCLYSSVIHILRCSTNEINLFISERSNTKGNGRTISRAVARGGKLPPKPADNFFKTPKFKSKTTCRLIFI